MEITQLALLGGAVAASMFLFLIYRTVKGYFAKERDDEPRKL
jgi:hypothetical protein